MKVYRTPDDRFRDLPLYPFAPHYIEYSGLRMHYLDEGQGDPILLLHGEPTWSYLYRRMIPELSRHFRVIAPDYLGFGRSDKPEDLAFYTYDLHTDTIRTFVEGLDLSHITLVGHDWGGPIGLRTAVELKPRFARLVVMNTGLFSGGGWPTPGFMTWRNFAERVGVDLPVAKVVERSCVRALDQPTLRAYEAPWPARESKAGVARFPLMVPLSPRDPGANEMQAVAAALHSWSIPALVIWSDRDPVFPPEMGQSFARQLPGAGEVKLIEGASHLLQEDKGEEIAHRILEWAATSAPRR